MNRIRVVGYSLIAFVLTSAAFAATGKTPAKLSAEEIVSRNVAARGGLDAWRQVQTLTMAGKMQAGGNQRAALPMPGTAASEKVVPSRPLTQAELPFLLELKRPLRSRLEVQFAGKTALQIFDGTNGWKLRPYLNRVDVEAYTPEEMKASLTQSQLDGPLVDYKAKGTTVELVGVEKVEGRDTYDLRLTLKNGQQQRVWIDTNTFLEARIEGAPRRLDGKLHPVYIYYRDYRPVHGLMIPYTLDTRVELTTPIAGSTEISELISISDVQVNPKLDDSLFTEPQLKDTHAQQAKITVPQMK